MDKLKILQTADVIDCKGRKRGKKVKIACPVCEVERWIRIDSVKRKEFTGMCITCHNKFTSNSMQGHPQWKGGSIKDGYREIKIDPMDMAYPMAKKNGYLREHRYVMANHLGRCLTTNEVVHHINGVRDDNRIENLELCARQADHLPSMADAATIKRLSDKVSKLEAIINNLLGSIRVDSPDRERKAGKMLADSLDEINKKGVTC